MKNINEIFNNLKSDPLFERLEIQENIVNFIKILPRQARIGVKFGYIQNNILFIVIKHPVYIHEFKFKIPFMKSLLTYSELDDDLDIQYYLSSKKEKKKVKPIIYEYKERSNAIFENNFKDNPKLYKKFEEIRDIIQDKLEND